MKTHASYLGIDVSKRKLHLGSPEKFLGEYDNNLVGHRKLVKRLLALKPIGVVLEASGGYERAAVDAMQDAGLAVTVAQPGCVKHFAKSVKVLPKTDEIDSQTIARYGEAVRPEPTPKTPQNIREFRALCDRRAQIVTDRVRESNRLETCADKEMTKHVKASLKRLKTMEKKLDQRIAAALKADDDLQRKKKAMTELTGVGEKTAVVLLAHLPELGQLSRQQVAAVAGMAPHPRESGNWKGKRRIYGGRAVVRAAMFMAARTAARCCPVIREFYLRLRANGKSYRTAIIACARKMLVKLNTILKELDQEKTAPNRTQST